MKQIHDLIIEHEKSLDTMQILFLVHYNYSRMACKSMSIYFLHLTMKF